MSDLPDVLRGLGVELEHALERLNLPAIVVDASGRIRWQNGASIALVGARLGAHFASVLAPEYSQEAQRAFARKLLGNEISVDREMVVVDVNGRRTRVVSSGVPLERGEQIVGVFGIARIVDGGAPTPRVYLTPRQHETLRLLAADTSAGCSVRSTRTPGSRPSPAAASSVSSDLLGNRRCEVPAGERLV